MRTVQSKLFRYCTIALCAAVVANGCRLERSVLPSIAYAAPGEYCPGDTVRASFDYLGTETCRDAMACAMQFPIVTMTSTPESFPPQSIQNYVGGVSFVPVGDAVTLNYAIDRSPVTVLTSRSDSRGVPINVERSLPRTQTQTIRRLTGVVETELQHPGMCAGGTPVNAPASLTGDSRRSPNLRLTQLCNANGVAVSVTLSGSAPGVSYTQMLMPRDCIDTSMPGVPAGINMSTNVEVSPLIADPSTRCSATGPSTPPPTLRTLARRSCG